jgi:hypothetical protein
MGTCSDNFTAAYLACNAFSMCRGYWILPTATLNPGNILYNNAACTVPFVGNGNWIALSYNGFGVISAVRVNSFGVILAYNFSCT